MARPDRSTTTPLTQRIADEPWKFEFVQAIRLLELDRQQRTSANTTSSSADAQRNVLLTDYDEAARTAAAMFDLVVPVDHSHETSDAARAAAHPESGDGHRDQAGGEGRLMPARLRASASLKRHASQVASSSVAENGRLELTLGGFGLFGSNGAMPFSYTKWIIDRLRDHDNAMRDFLDLFNHRLSWLLFQSSTRYRFPIDLERDRSMSGQDTDVMTSTLHALLGLGRPDENNGLRKRLESGDAPLLAYAGLFAMRRLSASVLGQVLTDYFQLPIRIEQFIRQWLRLSLPERSRLGQRRRGRSKPPAGRLGGAAPRPRRSAAAATALTPTCDTEHCHLGHDVILGERARDVHGRFRVWIGPVGYETFCRFLPEGDMHRSLVALVRHAAGAEFDFDLRPVLLRFSVPRCMLGRSIPPQRLGRNLWLGTRHRRQNFAGATLRPNENDSARPRDRKKAAL